MIADMMLVVVHLIALLGYCANARKFQDFGMVTLGDAASLVQPTIHRSTRNAAVQRNGGAATMYLTHPFLQFWVNFVFHVCLSFSGLIVS